jgi:ABC-type phosphate/phosphonate transport system ATPase subunit
MERRSLLQHRRDKCESWLRAINYSTAAPNELSTSCQNVLDIIDEHLRDLEVWLQAAPDDDRRELESITQPQLQRQAQNRFDQLSPAQQQAYWEHLYQQYRANRTQLLGTQEEGAFREYWWR